ncbi:HAD hydrolase-like protein [Actinokineospora sp. PR83]|uniref:HAD family hydrolase n=1 Tax=Actinokineospora sp. PR83 TaxID=2884908 RepID=UPI001F457D54|nr:HAD hydrolase-like protein [Actinokineospora sp. PR83]MCG8919879.1 HAD hydrolase-like protein [Actinokineospora sp. PR83]
MTRVHDWQAARTELNKTKLLLLDFDGPVCSVFSGLLASEVAIRLRNHLYGLVSGPLVGLDKTSSDPFDVLSYAVTHTPEHVAAIEFQFTQQECKAVQSAQPTAGAHALIKEWSRDGRPLAIVSNNSVDAIRLYLDIHDLTHAVSLISARTPQVVDKLKPAPYLINMAVSGLNIDPKDAAFIGDSLSDLVAGTSAGVTRIAFANKAWKRAALGSTCDILIEKFGR